MFLLLITFAVLLLFILVLKKSLLKSSVVGLMVVVLVIIFTDGYQINSFITPVFQGLLVAFEISLLIFGALLFYNYLKAGGFIVQLESSLHQFSDNRLVIAILLAFFFGSFIEGVSGFGTPAMIIAPLLLGLRYPAYLAAALPLLSNTIPVLFGAVGTPVKIGFAGLPTEHLPFYAAILVALPAVLIPIYFKFFLETDKLLINDEGNVRMYFVALLAGISFIITFIAFSFTGPDFPSMAASITGLFLWLLFVNKMKHSAITVSRSTITQLIQTFRPYLFIAILLISAKLLIGTSKFIIEWHDVGINKSISYFQPGLIFILGLLVLILFNRNKTTVSFFDIFKQTFLVLPGTFITIACLAVIAKLFAENLHVKELLNNNAIPTAMYYVLSVFTGFIGSFIAGSATVSNLMFGTEWYAVGHQLNLNISLLLAGQLAGASLGNSLSVQNIAMVQAVLNEKGLERAVISILWKPVLFFFTLICIVVLVISFSNLT